MRARLIAVTLAVMTAWPGVAWSAFDDVEASPRARALGCAWAALTGDAWAPFHNPATLAWTGAIGGEASWVRPFGYDFVSQGAIAATLPLPRGIGGAAVGLRRFGVEYRGVDLTHETTVAVSHGFKLLSDRQSEVAVGWTLNLYALDYGTSVGGVDPGSATGLGVNVGATAVVRDRTRVGFQVTNLNTPRLGDRDKEELRRAVTVGVSYAPYPGVETVLDLAGGLDGVIQYRGGAEFQAADYLWLRAGLQTEPNTLTAGFELRWAGMRLGYGFSTGGVLGDTHHVGIGVERPVLP